MVGDQETLGITWVCCKKKKGDQETLFVTWISELFLKYVTDYPPHTRCFFRFEPLPSKLKMGQYITNKKLMHYQS